ncbi:hypothetical protein J4423_02335 [Candidatus Pacearchaeota archaeon]|nr:hypothetical protein [Candidatus Pacearchaeota archaeon]
MHQTRNEVIRALPLPRKGTKYVAYASRHNSNSVSIVVAVRDMLKLANTSKEVKGMIHNKALKVNGKVAKDLHDPISLFSIFHADKNYKLTLLPTGRFVFEETKDVTRNLKIIGKTAMSKDMFQYGLHDGTSIASKQSFSVGDTLVLDFENKVTKHIALDKGKSAFIFSGSNIGKIGKIESVDEMKVVIKFEKEGIALNKAQVIVL